MTVSAPVLYLIGGRLLPSADPFVQLQDTGCSMAVFSFSNARFSIRDT